MSEVIKKSLRDSALARWGVLCAVAFTMLCAYFMTDVMNPLKPLLETQCGWDSTSFGLFSGAYSLFNVFLFMLIIGGIILDKMGVRFTGLTAVVLMLVGTGINYIAITPLFPRVETFVFGLRSDILTACLGFALFGVGAEVAGITVSRIIVKWFKGKEMALAMGIEMSTARLGTLLAMAIPLQIANKFGGVSKPLLLCLILLCIGLISFLIYCIQDKKLEAEGVVQEGVEEEDFKISDIKEVLRNRGFWLLALLCVLFYSAIFPWIKFSIDLMINKYQVDPSYAGLIPTFLPIGCLVLTPLFGLVYDYFGKGATIMIIGSILLIFVHILFSIPNEWIINNLGFLHIKPWMVAILASIILGITLSLLPSAMWPSVPKIIPENLLGTAYSLTFWVQNWGLMLVPMIIGFTLDATNVEVAPTKKIITSSIESIYRENANVLGFANLTENKLKEKVGEASNELVSYVLYKSDYKSDKDIDDNKVTLAITNMLESNIETLKNTNVTSNLEREFLDKSKEALLKMATELRLPLQLDYQMPNMIFILFGLFSLLVAFMLKRLDKVRKFGLEEPNIQK